MDRDALVVGINKYPFLKKDLTTPASDAEAIARRLEEYGGFRVRRLPEAVRDNQRQVEPSKSVSLKELEEAIAELFLPESNRLPQTALLFFAGHGLRKSIKSLTQGFLATSDAQPDKNSYGMPLQDLWRILLFILQKIKLSNQIFRQIDKVFQDESDRYSITHEFAYQFIEAIPASAMELDFYNFLEWLGYHSRYSPSSALELTEQFAEKIESREHINFWRTKPLIVTLNEILREADETDDPELIQRAINLPKNQPKPLTLGMGMWAIRGFSRLPLGRPGNFMIPSPS